MPNYTYYCQCGAKEVSKPMERAGDLEVCEECGHIMRRLFRTPMFNMNKWNSNFKFVDVSQECNGYRDACTAGFED